MAEAVIIPEQIYADYRDSVGRYVRSRVANEHDAEDIVSDVFARVLKDLSLYDKRKASVSTWIYTITKCTVIDYYRRYDTRKDVIDTELLISDPEEEIVGRETLTELAAALDRLDERERDIIIMHYYKEMPLTAISDIKGMSYSNVKVVHKAALSKLRKILSD